MRHTAAQMLMWVAIASAGFAQTSTPPPQTARQALIEMFTGKGPNDFVKHLPDAARQALVRKGGTSESSIVLKISEIGRQITASGEHVETFDVGPNILVTTTERKNGPRQKVEVAIEHDSLMGEQDEIELSFHFYKDGQPQFLPVIPRLTLTLKQENEVWKLIEITAAARVPLTDPDYLKGVRKEQDEANEAAAQMRVGSIVAAETLYAAKNPNQGYTCSLTTAFAPDPAALKEGEPYNPALFDPGQGNTESNGYRFTLSGCDGNPSSKYRIVAEPTEPDSEMKTFCADESGTVKSLAGGKSSSCFSQGKVVNMANVQFTLD